MIAKLIVFAILSTVSSWGQDELFRTAIAYHTKEIEKELDHDRWSVKIEQSSIVIDSKFTFQKTRRVSPALGAPAEVVNYQIRLEFKDELTKSRFIKISHDRVTYAAVLAYGATTKDEYHLAKKFLTENPLPRYDIIDNVGKRYSIYRTTSDDTDITLLPTRQYSEAKGVEGVVDQLLWTRSE